MNYTLINTYNRLKRHGRSDFLSIEPVSINSFTKENCHLLYIEETNIEILKEFYNTYINNDYLYIRTTVKNMYCYQEIIYQQINDLRDNDIIEYKTKIVNPLENYSVGIGSSKFVENYEDDIVLDVLNCDIYEKMFMTNINDYKHRIIIVEILDIKYINREYKITKLLNTVKNFIKEDIF